MCVVAKVIEMYIIGINIVQSIKWLDILFFPLILVTSIANMFSLLRFCNRMVPAAELK